MPTNKKKWWKPTLTGTAATLGIDAYVDPAPYLKLLQAIVGGKKGGRVTARGIGVAKRGFGKALRKK